MSKLFRLKDVHTIKQYNPNKPKKWGYKLYVVYDDEGSVYNSEVHTRKIAACPNHYIAGSRKNCIDTFTKC